METEPEVYVPTALDPSFRADAVLTLGSLVLVLHLISKLRARMARRHESIDGMPPISSIQSVKDGLVTGSNLVSLFAYHVVYTKLRKIEYFSGEVSYLWISFHLLAALVTGVCGGHGAGLDLLDDFLRISVYTVVFSTLVHTAMRFTVTSHENRRTPRRRYLLFKTSREQVIYPKLFVRKDPAGISLVDEEELCKQYPGIRNAALKDPKLLPEVQFFIVRALKSFTTLDEGGIIGTPNWEYINEMRATSIEVPCKPPHAMVFLLIRTVSLVFACLAVYNYPLNEKSGGAVNLLEDLMDHPRIVWAREKKDLIVEKWRETRERLRLPNDIFVFYPNFLSFVSAVVLLHELLHYLSFTRIRWLLIDFMIPLDQRIRGLRYNHMAI